MSTLGEYQNIDFSGPDEITIMRTVSLTTTGFVIVPFVAARLWDSFLRKHQFLIMGFKPGCFQFMVEVLAAIGR